MRGLQRWLQLYIFINMFGTKILQIVICKFFAMRNFAERLLANFNKALSTTNHMQSTLKKNFQKEAKEKEYFHICLYSKKLKRDINDQYKSQVQKSILQKNYVGV